MPSLAQIAHLFIQRNYLSHHTKRSYEITLTPFLAQIGYLSIEIISPETISNYLLTLNHLAYTTQQRHFTIIQALFNFALEKGYIKINPLGRLSPPQPNKYKGEHHQDEIFVI